jgi:hypothetical protein
MEVILKCEGYGLMAKPINNDNIINLVTIELYDRKLEKLRWEAWISKPSFS